MTFIEQTTEAMTWLGQQPLTLFVGQAVRYDSQALFNTFSGVPDDKKVELPVIEEFQMGFCTGLALQGFIPICFFPRIDFMLLACNQLVNHLDKIPMMSIYRPKVIIRTTVGSDKPLDAGLQHTQNHTEAFKHMLDTVRVVYIRRPEEVLPAYRGALKSMYSTLIVENPC